MKFVIFTILIFSIQLVKSQGVSFTWARQMGGPSNEASAAIALDNQGNVYTTGWFAGTSDFDPGPGSFLMNSTGGSSDIFVCKMDPGGNLIWAKHLGGILEESGSSITIDPAGNILITGYFTGTADFDPSATTFNLTALGNHDIFITRLTTNGDHLWTKQLGGPGFEVGSNIKTDVSGNVYSTGGFSGTTDFDPGAGIYNLTATGSMDYYVSKLDMNGNFLWAIIAGGDGEGGPALDIDNSANVFVTGGFEGNYDFDPGPSVFSLSSISGTDIFVSKYNSAGNLVWAKKMGGASYENAYNIAVSLNGNVYICGDFSSFVDFDPGTTSFNMLSLGNYDIFVCKLDPNGSFIWARQMGGGGLDAGLSIAVDNAENVFTTGIFRGPGDYDPGYCEYILQPANSNDDIFISKLDVNGGFKWAKRIGGNSSDLSQAIAVNQQGDVYITGYFAETADFDPGQGIYTLATTGVPDMFVHKMSPCNSSLSTHITATSCGEFVIGCHILNQSGTYTAILENYNGCDSVVIVDLTIVPVMSNVSVSTCNSYQFNGQTLTDSGIYYDTITTTNGCDSIIKLTLTITSAATSTQSIVGCAGFNWHGQELTTSGVYKDTLTGSNGCDSIIILHLTLLPTTSSLTVVNTCDSYFWGGNLYTATGIYRDTFVSNASCDSIAVLQLTVGPTINSLVTQTICRGQIFEGYSTTGIFKDSFLTAVGCDSIRTLNLTVSDPPVPHLGPDTVLCPGDSIKISPGTFPSYQWQDGSSNDHYMIRQPGTYSVMVSNSCGTGTDEIIISENNCDLYFPSAFTPNQDGKNDVFKALGNPQLAEFSLTVFNRWGEKIFSTFDLSQGWNGTIKGRAQPTGAYAWYCIYRKTTGGEKMVVKGTILLIR